MSNEVFIDGDADAIQLRVQGNTTQTHPLQTWEDSNANVLAQVDENGQVLIDGQQDQVQLRVQAHSTQTNALQAWEDSAGDTLAQITGDGRLEVGDLDLSTPDALAEVNRDITLPSNVPQRGVQSRGLIRGAISNAIAWAVHELELLGDSAVSGLHTALRGKITHKSTGDANLAELRAGDFEAINEGGNSSNPVGEMIGVQSTVSNEQNGHLNKAVGVKVTINDEGTDSIQNAYGLLVEDVDQGAQANYAIHTGQGAVHLGDYMEIVTPGSVPGQPAQDNVRIYPKSDGKLYAKDWQNTEYDLTGGGGGPSADLTLTTKTLLTREVLFDETLSIDGTWDESISQDYDHLEIMLLGRTDKAGTNDTAKVYFNDDTTDANYLQANHVGGDTHSVTVNAHPYLGNLPGDTARANNFGHIYALILNYTDTAKEKIARAEGAYRYDGSSARLNERGVAWENTAAINRIAIVPHGGTDFKAGSRLQIIGIRETMVVTDVSGNVTADLTGVVQDNDFEQAGDVLVGTGAGAFDQITLTGNNQYLGTDGNGVVGVFGLPSGGASAQIPAAGLCQGRLTLTSGTPLPTANVTAASQVYFTPYQGNQLSLYDGADWEVYALAELSIKLTDTQNGTTASGSAVVTGLTDTSQLVVGMEVSGASIPVNTTLQSIDSASQVTLDQTAIATGTNALTFSVPADTNVDIFCYRNGMAPKLNMVLWADDTTRAVALTLQDGVYVKAGAATRRYLGTVRTTSAAGQTEDSETRRYLYNEYHKLPRKLKAVETISSWTYSASAWRAAHNNLANRVALVIGNPGPLVRLDLLCRMAGAGSGGAHGIAYDAVNTTDVDVFPNVSINGHAAAHLQHYPAVGCHYYQWVENARGNSCTMYGYSASGYQSGMVGEVML
jgi:hypothetical protein